MNATPSDVRQFHDHSRHWQEFRYVYPVISRRARGLSIGINLNPDKHCNWNCVYCQVDRTAAPVVEHVDEQRLFDELARLVNEATAGTLWREPSFVSTPHNLRLMQDFALSGDGEPASYPRFTEILDRLLRFRKACGFERLPVTLFTNATLLHLPRVQAGLALLSNATNRVWCKLDAGTESSFQRVNASRYSLEHCLNNIAALGRQRPIEIQSMFMAYDGAPPPDEEVAAYIGRLVWLVEQGARIDRVQLYTIARPTASQRCTVLDDDALERLKLKINAGIPALNVECFSSAA